jgi:hypothetical protein
VDPVQRGVLLKEIDLSFDQYCPLLYKLDLPLILIAPPDMHDKSIFNEVIQKLGMSLDEGIMEIHQRARETDRDIFCSVIEVYYELGPGPAQGSLALSASFNIQGFSSFCNHYDRIVGADSYVYRNISKQIDKILKGNLSS